MKEKFQKFLKNKKAVGITVACLVILIASIVVICVTVHKNNVKKAQEEFLATSTTEATTAIETTTETTTAETATETTTVAPESTTAKSDGTTKAKTENTTKAQSSNYKLAKIMCMPTANEPFKQSQGAAYISSTPVVNVKKGDGETTDFQIKVTIGKDNAQYYDVYDDTVNVKYTVTVYGENDSEILGTYTYDAGSISNGETKTITTPVYSVPGSGTHWATVSSQMY